LRSSAKCRRRTVHKYFLVLHLSIKSAFRTNLQTREFSYECFSHSVQMEFRRMHVRVSACTLHQIFLTDGSNCC
ncbi:hypothetical protein MAR_033104, partial [Mya arenaria]